MHMYIRVYLGEEVDREPREQRDAPKGLLAVGEDELPLEIGAEACHAHAHVVHVHVHVHRCTRRGRAPS